MLSIGIRPGTASGQSPEAYRGPHAAQHAVDMVLYGLLGEVQVRSDLFICETLRNQGDQLLLLRVRPNSSLIRELGTDVHCRATVWNRAWKAEKGIWLALAPRNEPPR